MDTVRFTSSRTGVLVMSFGQEVLSVITREGFGITDVTKMINFINLLKTITLIGEI
jgi:hypothetical protein